MKEFTRPPTRRERALAIALNIVLACLFGSLAVFLHSRGVTVAAVVCALVTSIWIGLLYRATFGQPRALGASGSRALAWTLLLGGMAGFVLAALVPGTVAHRLMVLGASVTFFSAGLVGVRARGQDA